MFTVPTYKATKYKLAVKDHKSKRCLCIKLYEINKELIDWNVQGKCSKNDKIFLRKSKKVLKILFIMIHVNILGRSILGNLLNINYSTLKYSFVWPSQI